jgi:hypothetical protein
MALDAAIVGVTAEWLVSSIDGLVETHPQLSREWVGLILLPIVSPTYPIWMKRTDEIGRKCRGALHSSFSVGQGQDRSLNLCRSWFFDPNRPLCHSSHSVTRLVHQ